MPKFGKSRRHERIKRQRASIAKYGMPEDLLRAIRLNSQLHRCPFCVWVPLDRTEALGPGNARLQLTCEHHASEAKFLEFLKAHRPLIKNATVIANLPHTCASEILGDGSQEALKDSTMDQRVAIANLLLEKLEPARLALLESLMVLQAHSESKDTKLDE
jgi:hypothetical protein